MKAGGRRVKLVDQAGRAHTDREAGFLMDFSDQVLGQGCSRLHPTTRRTPERAGGIGIGIHQQQPPILDDHGTGG